MSDHGARRCGVRLDEGVANEAVNRICSRNTTLKMLIVGGMPSLLATGRRHDAVHAEVHGDLAVVVEAMPDDDGGHAQAGSRSFAEGALNGFQRVGIIDGSDSFVGV